MTKRDPSKKFLAGWIHQDLWDWVASEAKRQDRSKVYVIEQKLAIAKKVETPQFKNIEDMA